MQTGLTAELSPSLCHALLETLPVALLVTDPTGNVLAVSGGWQALCQARGEPFAAAQLGRSYLDVIERGCGLDGLLLAKLHRTFSRCLDEPDAANPAPVTAAPLSDPLTLAGEQGWFEFTVSPVGLGEGVTIVCRDVSETRYAGYDVLTELSNRVLFERGARKVLGLAERNRQGVSLLYLDLNGFKEVNDRLGHAVGDAVLREVARRLLELSRGSDLLSRHGGDEFLVLLYNTTRQQAFEAAERYRAGLARPFSVRNTSLSLQSSWGIAHYPEATTLTDLIQQADSAMYRAKATGGGVRVYS